MRPEVQTIVDEIEACTDDMNAAVKQYLEKLHALKLKLARVCGHERVTHEWAWTRCLDCGTVELTATFISHRRRGLSARAAEITAW